MKQLVAVLLFLGIVLGGTYINIPNALASSNFGYTEKWKTDCVALCEHTEGTPPVTCDSIGCDCVSVELVANLIGIQPGGPTTRAIKVEWHLTGGCIECTYTVTVHVEAYCGVGEDCGEDAHQYDCGTVNAIVDASGLLDEVGAHPSSYSTDLFQAWRFGILGRNQNPYVHSGELKATFTLTHDNSNCGDCVYETGEKVLTATEVSDVNWQ